MKPVAGSPLAADVAPAAAEFAARRAARRKREADAGVILEAAMLDRIDGERQVRRGRAEQRRRPRPGAPAPLAARRGRSRSLQRPRARRAPGPAARSRAPKACRGARRAGDRRRVLAVERRDQRAAVSARARGRARGDHGRHQGRQGEVERQPATPSAASASAASSDHLGIGRRAGGADQLGADLAELALGPELGALDAQHLAGIGQAQRPRRAQAGGGDARDLRRHVGAQPHHALRDRVHQPEAVPAIAAPGPVSRLSSNSTSGGFTRS